MSRCKVTKERLASLDSDTRAVARRVHNLMGASRESMLRFMQENDRNGTYTDREVREEYGDEGFSGHRWSKYDAWKELRRILYEDVLPSDFCGR